MPQGGHSSLPNADRPAAPDAIVSRPGSLLQAAVCPVSTGLGRGLFRPAHSGNAQKNIVEEADLWYY